MTEPIVSTVRLFIHRHHGIARGLLLVGAVTACSAKLTARVASVEGFSDAEVKMTAKEAAIIDKMETEAPEGDATAKFLKQALVTGP